MTFRLLFAHPFDPWGSKAGGIETAIRNMLQHAPEDFSVGVIGVTEDPSIRPVGQWTRCQLEDKAVDFYPLFPVLKPNRRTWFPLFLRFALHLRRLSLDTQDALLFYHRIEPMALSRSPGKASVLYIHSDPREWIGRGSEVRWKYLPGLYRQMESAAVGKADRVLAVTRSAVNYLSQKYPHKTRHISFLPSAYQDTLFYTATGNERTALRRRFADEYKLPMNAPWLLFAGRMERQKNPALAVQAFSTLTAVRPDAHLLMAGEGRLQGEAQRQAEALSAQSPIHWLGALPGRSLAELMRTCDLFLLASAFEGLPIAALEALASGLPVVSTRVGEMPSVIVPGLNGLIVETPSPDALAHAMAQVLAAPEQFNSEQCAASVREYRTDVVLEQMYKCFRKLPVGNNL